MPVPAHVANEYGTLQRVAMRYAGEFTRPVDGPDIHPVLVRQQATSTWAPYNPAKVRAHEVPEIRGSAVRLFEATGWRPEIPLERTLADTLESHRR